MAVAATPARAGEIVTVVAVPKARVGATLTALPGAKALFAGGDDLRDAEIFDFATNSWSAAKPMNVARSDHGAVRLADGRVLVIGGRSALSGAYLSSAEVYDSKTNTWTLVASSTYVHGPAVAVGATSAIGALTADKSARDFEIYDPIADVWTTRAASIYFHPLGALGALKDGFLAVGTGSMIERYNTAKNTWTPLPALFPGRNKPTLVTLRDGRLLIVGGGETASGASPAVFDPTTNTIKLLTGGDLRMGGAGAELLPDGRVLMLGSSALTRPSGVVPTIDLFDPAMNKVEPIADMMLGNAQTAMAEDGRVLAVIDGAVSALVISVPRRCTNATECASGFCVDNYCCDSACTGQCEACDAAGSLGTCSPVRGAPHGARTECSPPWTPACRVATCDGYTRTACAVPAFKQPCDCSKDSDCDSGFCTDGVCCNTRCDGQCEACDLPGARGTCLPVTGEPRGIRKGCPIAGRGICTVQACDGANGASCTYIHQAETACDSICGGRVQRHCDGRGGCGLADELKCPNDSCSTASPQPSERARFFDALIVLGALGLVRKRVRAWRAAPRPSCPRRDR